MRDSSEIVAAAERGLVEPLKDEPLLTEREPVSLDIVSAECRAQESVPTRQRVVLSLPQDHAAHLRRVLDSLPDCQRWFPARCDWSDPSGAFVQEFADGCRSFVPNEWPDPPLVAWVTTLAEIIDDLHRHGVRLNGLNLGSLILDDSGTLRGLRVPPCLTFVDTPAADVPLMGLNFGIAAPEIQQYLDVTAGPRADVFLLAAMSFYMLTRVPLRDLMRGDFELLQPTDNLPTCTRRALSSGLALDPARRPATAQAYAALLREAQWRDQNGTELIVTAAGDSDLGLGGREANQDAYVMQWTAGDDASGSWLRGIVAVCDGMGGGMFGERASGFCIDRLQSFWGDCGFAFRATGGRLSDARLAAENWLRQVNQDTLRLGEALGTNGNFGTTLSALVVLGRHALLFHAGDSLVYRWRRGELCLLTESQTAELLVSRGEDIPGDPADLRVILFSFAGSRRFEPLVNVLSIEPGDVYFLSSDGPLEGLTDSDLQDVLPNRSAAAAVSELLDRAKSSIRKQQSTSETPDVNRLFYSDNLTIVVVRFDGSSPTVAATGTECRVLNQNGEATDLPQVLPADSTSKPADANLPAMELPDTQDTADAPEPTDTAVPAPFIADVLPFLFWDFPPYWGY